MSETMYLVDVCCEKTSTKYMNELKWLGFDILNRFRDYHNGQNPKICLFALFSDYLHQTGKICARKRKDSIRMAWFNDNWANTDLTQVDSTNDLNVCLFYADLSR